MRAEAWMLLSQATVAMTLALLVVLAVRTPLRRRMGARLGYAAWLSVPACLLAVLLPASDPGVAAQSAGLSAMLPTLVAKAQAMATPATSFQAWLLGIWLLGAVAALCVFGLQQRRFERQIRRTPGEPADRIAGHGPAVAGLWRPRVILPEDFEQRYTREQQQLVLAHERLHLHRGDVAAQAVASFLRSLFWFHPLAHLAMPAFRVDQELACDADVLSLHPNARRAYGEAMLRTQLADFGLPVGCQWQSSHPLKERLAMLKHPLPGIVRRTTGRVLLAGLLAGVAVAAAAARPGVADGDDEGPGVAKPAQVRPAGSTAPDPNQAAPAGQALPLPYMRRITSEDVMTPPEYPKELLGKGISGKVMLKIFVNDDGDVTETIVQSSEPAGVFDEAATSAVSTWHFSPMALDTTGRRPRGWVLVPLEFRPD